MATIVQGEPVNKATPKNVVSHSTFRLDPHFFTTMRFGEYQPHCAFEGVPKDRITLQSSHEVRSYTMGSPLMSDVFIKKDYFCVPMQCVLPRNWEKVYRNPKNGDDVDASEVGTSVTRFAYKVSQLISGLSTALEVITEEAYQSEPLDLTPVLTAQIKFMLLCERFLSNGSLLAQFGANLSRICSVYYSGVSKSSHANFDNVFDKWISNLIQTLSGFVVGIGTNTYMVDVDGTRLDHVDANPTSNVLSLRDFLTIARDDSSFSVESITFKVGESDLPAVPSEVDFSWAPSVQQEDSFPLNLGRCFAYQIVCAHFFSNDNVDYIFSADLYRQNLQSLEDEIWKSLSVVAPCSFDYNGVSTLYDACSAFYFNQVCGIDSSAFVLAEDAFMYMNLVYDYTRLVFGFNRSLRFQDYFTGSRPHPLAVGDVGAQVVDGSVSAINTTRSIQMQRFLNAVNRLPQKIENYLEGIFPGDRPRPDQHDPIWLGHTGDVVFGSEVENTGSDQFNPEKPVSVSSVLRGNASNFAFEFTVDRPSWIIGLTYFDIPRSYYKGISRILQHVDRFDMFNPFLQYIGDQPIFRSELDSYADNGNFSYTLRHMEYKQEYDRAAGGFAAGLLPGWTFLADDDARSSIDNNQTISPDYIRSRPSEMDKFYIALSGWSMASYFHFIVKNYNRFEAKRDMVYAPSIL